ncbi:DUF6084 family protein [Tengunoibacter tsumagoiensis]|uniref:Uncharacterized protein n=1 Tax=Tengunoibacter tsumagoiensis TaxID=2014871 RepID=A0A402A0W3_9CHLR|nr:DUF6084 family protein [Tengunoibacter tsumagoiensis]GCE12788.1 hypothetical protein KTT_26470 [Tengunoibacter tsumagoiensis]
MPDLNFEVIGAETPAFAAMPTLIFKLRITNSDEHEMIHTVALRTQLQIAVTRRNYTASSQAQLLDVFDEPARWGTTLKNLLWTHISTIVPSFTGSTMVELSIPCTYDFEVVTTKYFHALDSGEIPLLFQFSGSIFYATVENALQVMQVSWKKEASYRLPVLLWQEMMERYYPNSVWLHLDKEIFDRLYHYKLHQRLPTWEATFAQLLQRNGEEVPQ